jgi:hypothetical protein
VTEKNVLKYGPKAEHEDRKAALQIQRDILNQSQSGIFDGTDGGETAKKNRCSSL